MAEPGEIQLFLAISIQTKPGSRNTYGRASRVSMVILPVESEFVLQIFAARTYSSHDRQGRAAGQSETHLVVRSL